jgi:hypothetical protein
MSARRVLLGVLVLAIVAGGVAFVVTRDSDGEDIFLEGAGDTGPNPFTTIATRACAPGYEAAPNGAGCVPTTTSSVDQQGSTTTALYGGSGSQKRCDPEALISYLTSHPDKAKAWVQGLNEDPTVEWNGGHTVTVDDIPAYIRELTPTFLNQDTRVTNHGYFNGKATPHQSVLQKGTAVLVDRNGVPRSRCACGNPLGRPHKVRHPHYKGHCWRGCHDRPYCAPPGCADTTTSTSSTTTTLCSSTTSSSVPLKTAAAQAGTQDPGGPDPCPTTSTSFPIRKPAATTTTTTTAPPTTTTMPTTTTTFTIGRLTTTTQPTTSTRDPNCPPPGPVDCKP